LKTPSTFFKSEIVEPSSLVLVSKAGAKGFLHPVITKKNKTPSLDK